MPLSKEPTVLQDAVQDCDLRCHDHHPYLEIPKNQGEATTKLVQCNRCNLVFEHPRPSAEAFDEFYKDERLWTLSKDAEGNPRSYIKEIEKKVPFFRDLARRVEQRKKSGNLLDVGCGAGILETQLDLSKWRVTGVDLSEFIARFGKEKLGTHVLRSSFESADLPRGHFDVIVMKYVLDHMTEPFQALKRARELIKPDGLLVIADLINIESFCARYFKDGHRLFHPMHFTYFSPATITQHLNRAGFAVEKIEYPFFKTSYFTVPNLLDLLVKIIAKFLKDAGILKTARVYSAPFYGSMMDAWAVPV